MTTFAPAAAFSLKQAAMERFIVAELNEDGIAEIRRRQRLYRRWQLLTGDMVIGRAWRSIQAEVTLAIIRKARCALRPLPAQT